MYQRLAEARGWRWDVVVATPTASGAVCLETITISWLPVGGDVQLRNLRPVDGHNYSLDRTLAIMAAYRAQVSMWGPYEVSRERYESAVEHAEHLASGAVRYRVLDTPFYDKSIEHCVHAVTYADPVLSRLIQPVIQVGEPGTSRLAARYRRVGAFLGGGVTYDWIIPAIGLDHYQIIRREPGEWIHRHWLR